MATGPAKGSSAVAIGAYGVDCTAPPGRTRGRPSHASFQPLAVLPGDPAARIAIRDEMGSN